MCKLDIKPTGAKSNGYSCGATILQILVKHVKGFCINHEEAIRLSKCKPDGCDTKDMIIALRKLGIKSSRIQKNERYINSYLTQGCPIVINDMLSYDPDDHWILISGYTEHYYYILDPNKDYLIKRSKNKVLKWSSDDGIFVVHKY